jgi:hypothetical protein
MKIEVPVGTVFVFCVGSSDCSDSLVIFVGGLSRTLFALLRRRGLDMATVLDMSWFDGG